MHPDMEFVVEAIKRVPWSLWYGSFYEPPIPSGGPLGNRHLNLPTNAVPKIGKEVKGFTLVGFEEKFKTREIHGNQVKVDASILTIQRGNRTFTMQKGRCPYHEYKVRLRHGPTGKITTLAVGDTLVAGTARLRGSRRL